MERYMKSTIIFGLLIVASLIYAQDLLPAEDQAPPFEYESEYYRVRSYISEAHAQESGMRLDAYFGHFNKYFHFDLAELDYKLRVQIFGSQEEYDGYLSGQIDEQREEFVYLHNSVPSRSELVGATENGAPFDQSFTHQAFVQFIRTFIDNPPLWLREGFAVYFEETQYDPLGLNAGNDLAWLATLKNIILGNRNDEALSNEDIFFIDLENAKENIEVFYPQSWGIVYYLINTEKTEHNRILWDAISAMDPEVDLRTNSQLVYKNALQWIPPEVLAESFLEYFVALKTYPELIEGGIVNYIQGNLASAREDMQQAIELRDDNFVPYYYLGLINYDEGNYGLAELFYQKALDIEQQDATIYYALGLNAFVNNQYEKASAYFETTLELDQESFAEKVDRVQKRMES